MGSHQSHNVEYPSVNLQLPCRILDPWKADYWGTCGARGTPVRAPNPRLPKAAESPYLRHIPSAFSQNTNPSMFYGMLVEYLRFGSLCYNRSPDHVLYLVLEAI